MTKSAVSFFINLHIPTLLFPSISSYETNFSPLLFFIRCPIHACQLIGSFRDIHSGPDLLRSPSLPRSGSFGLSSRSYQLGVLETRSIRRLLNIAHTVSQHRLTSRSAFQAADRECVGRGGALCRMATISDPASGTVLQRGKKLRRAYIRWRTLAAPKTSA